MSAQDPTLRQPSRILPYLQVLDRHAFGNFRELLTAITLNPAMGRYLDMVGNKASAPSVEQYAATLATWLGVSQTGLMEVFPNLSHFDTANLGFLS